MRRYSRRRAVRRVAGGTVTHVAGRAVTGPLAFLVSGLVDLAVLLGYVMKHRGANLLIILVLALAILGGVGAASARAGSTEESILMDDQAFIYSSPSQVEANLQQVASLGVDVIKVSIVWSLLAPDPNAKAKPHFDATDPGAYPAGNWTRYDTLVKQAHALGLQVYFQLTAPAPAWATDPRSVSGHQYAWSHQPNVKDFQQFVEAVGSRYSGAYTPPGASAALPGVRMWGIWNEPNEVGWLSPQQLRLKGRLAPVAPSIYRAMADAGFQGLVATGHSLDTILIGETASGGKIHVLPFVRDLYCVGPAGRPLRGAAAVRARCPASGDARRFVEDNQGLFAATGFAHHPYSFNQAPNRPFKTAPSTITLANIGELERTLDAAFRAYGQPAGLPIYVTEWGYKSNPPNPLVKTSLAQQETWLDQGWYMSYRQARVKTMAQMLLYDQPPVATAQPGTGAYWANFDTGLEFLNGSQKPAYGAFRLPIWVPRPRTGARVTLWAELRPALLAGNASALLQFQASGGSGWSTLTQLRTTSPEGFILTHVALPQRGSVRIAWGDPLTRAVYYSRSVRIN